MCTPSSYMLDDYEVRYDFRNDIVFLIHGFKLNDHTKEREYVCEYGDGEFPGVFHMTKYTHDTFTVHIGHLLGDL